MLAEQSRSVEAKKNTSSTPYTPCPFFCYTPPHMSSQPAAAARLCTACGMCCNGVLFQVVRLQPADSLQQLSALGMKLKRKKKEPYFTQPCAFLTADCSCTIYAARPTRCRQFHCQLLQRLTAAQITEAEAMHTVAKVKAHTAAITALLPDADPRLALSEQVQQAIAENPQQEALWTAMEQLQALLAADFLPRPQPSLATPPAAQQDAP